MSRKVAAAGLLAVLLLAGTAYAHWGYYAAPAYRGMPMMPMMPWMTGYGGWGYGMGYEAWLTEEQRAEIQDRVKELREEGAPPWEIRAEVFRLLQRFGAVTNETTPVPGYGFGWGYGYPCPMMGYGW
jgi:Spy/CpxP family protein refolding chaperone